VLCLQLLLWLLLYLHAHAGSLLHKGRLLLLLRNSITLCCLRLLLRGGSTVI
jgi:hypothetical protein